jgi:chromatin modification-related protein EAF6
MQDSPGPLSAQTTPSAAPTPANSSFPKGDASNVATPTSATSANKSGAGQKKVKRNGDDSETDTKDAKKARTNFGASRK